MTWWAWTLLWVVLVAGALFVFFRIGRTLWRKAGALLAELGEASERLSAVSDQLEALAEARPAEEPAVFSDPAALRRQRYLDRRSAPAPAGPARAGRSTRARDVPGTGRRT